jgi:hypothetical protein
MLRVGQNKGEGGNRTPRMFRSPRPALVSSARRASRGVSGNKRDAYPLIRNASLGKIARAPARLVVPPFFREFPNRNLTGRNAGVNRTAGSFWRPGNRLESGEWKQTGGTGEVKTFPAFANPAKTGAPANSNSPETPTSHSKAMTELQRYQSRWYHRARGSRELWGARA